MTGASPIGDVLEDVRRAHRLVHAYYRRVLDTMRVAVEEVERRCDVPLPYRDWQPYRYSWPRNGDVTDPGRWAWDGLPYAHMEAWFTSSREPGPGGVYLSIAHVVDTGFIKEGKVEPDSRHFLGVEHTTSTFGPVIIVPGGPLTTSKWSNFHAVVEGASNYTGWGDGKVHHLDIEGSPVAYGGFDVDLARLATEADLRDNLVEPLVRMISVARSRS
jgi:hypothetical protein